MYPPPGRTLNPIGHRVGGRRVFTARKTELGKLIAYRDELTDRYLRALRRHDAGEARRLYDLRSRVRRDIWIRQEWGESISPALGGEASN